MNLTGRAYRTQVVDALSQETRIKSGVPQGSVIGSLLFLLFVHDLPSIINVITLLFADDAKMDSRRSQSDRLLHLQCIELVGKLGHPYQYHQMHLYRYWAGSSTYIIPCHWIPGDSIRIANVVKDLGQLFLTLKSLQRGSFQSKTYVVYDKAVVH